MYIPFLMVVELLSPLMRIWLMFMVASFLYVSWDKKLLSLIMLFSYVISGRSEWDKLFIQLPVCLIILASQTSMHISSHVLSFYEQQNMWQ